MVLIRAILVLLALLYLNIALPHTVSYSLPHPATYVSPSACDPVLVPTFAHPIAFVEPYVLYFTVLCPKYQRLFRVNLLDP